MTSIVGANTRISVAKKKRPKSKATGKYLQRNKSLPYLGYSSYRDYLRSSDWSVIRKDKMTNCPNCECCGKPASCIHHYCYHDSVLLGLYPALLVSVCNCCHKQIEFDEYKQKRSLESSQKHLHWMLRSNERKFRSDEIRSVLKPMLARERKAVATSITRRDTEPSNRSFRTQNHKQRSSKPAAK